MNDAVKNVTPPQKPDEWTEALWLNRLSAAVCDARQSNSALAAALPTMLIALGWLGTGRSLAALLPPPEEPIRLEDIERLLADIGFRSERIVARGKPADTARLRPGSLALRSEKVAVYLGQVSGVDRWFSTAAEGGFDLAAGDVILSIQSNPDFHPIGEPQRGWFRGLFERLRDQLFELFAMSVFINVLALTVALYTMIVYSQVIPSGAIGSIWGIALLATITVVGAWVLRVQRQRTISFMGSWAGARIGEVTMRKMLGFPLDVSTKFGIHNNVIRMRSFENARQFLTGAGGAHLIDYPFVVIFLLVIALLGGWLVSVPIVSLLIYTAIAFPTADYVASKAATAGIAARRVEESAGSAFTSINAFYRTGGGNRWLNQFVDYAGEAANRNRDYAIAVARAQAIGQALSSLTVLATMCIGVLFVLNGTMHAGGLVASMMLIWRIVVPAQQAFSSLVRVRQIRSSVNALDQLVMTPSERSGVEITSPSGLTSATVAVDRVYYRPDPDQEAALNGVSFVVPAGSRTAIVGPNAAGKTALLECLAGLRRPQSGRILVNGRDIRQFDVAEYRAWIGYVPQIVPALPVTVREYLRLRLPTISDSDAKLAFHRIVGADWPGYKAFGCTQHSVLDRQLNPFSANHEELRLRHLVAFVAATLGSPEILLLDGIGLGVDPEWDNTVERYLDTVRGRTTVIWSPYSRSHIVGGDQIVVLERGMVRHVGPTAQPAATVAMKPRE